jgi:hypothetical protein
MGRAAARRAAELSHCRERPMSAFPPKSAYVRTLVDVSEMPCVDGSVLARAFFTFAAWVGAAMCLAFRCGSHDPGHNALRGSGPGQKPAFDNNAMAQVGCPDRRIDRLCIMCCSLLQPSHHAGCCRFSHNYRPGGASMARRPRAAFLWAISVAPSPQCWRRCNRRRRCRARPRW